MEASFDDVASLTPLAAALSVVNRLSAMSLVDQAEAGTLRALALGGNLAVHAAIEVLVADGDVAECADTLRRIVAIAAASASASARPRPVDASVPALCVKSDTL